MYARSFTLLVSLACAATSFAAPVASSAGLIGDVAVTPIVSPTVSTAAVGLLPIDVVGTATGVIAGTSDILRRDQITLPQIFKGLTTKITPLVDTLKTAVANELDVDVDLVKTTLENIVDILTEVKDDVKAIVSNPAGFVGTVVSVQEILITLGPVLTLIFNVLALVFTVVAKTPAGPILVPIIAAIGSLVGAILVSVLQFVPALLGPLLPIIASLPIVGDLTNILSL